MHTLAFSTSKTIPVVFAMDEGYLLPTCVALTSLLQAKDEKTFLDVFIMLPHLLSQESQETIDQLYQRFVGFEIHFLEMSDAFSDIEMRIDHITSPTYYRLLIADLLPQYNKCIYLDGDIIVMKDLWNLFSTQIGDNFVAGVKAPAYITAKDGNAGHCKKIGIPSIEQYINAGVLLMNLDAIRREKLTHRFIELSKNAFSSQDQDVINSACFGHIFHLPFHFNMMTKYAQNPEKLITVFGTEEVDYAKKDPTIIHYADKEKPWNNPFVQCFDEWFAEYARSPVVGMLPSKMVMAENCFRGVESRLRETESRLRETESRLRGTESRLRETERKYQESQTSFRALDDSYQRSKQQLNQTKNDLNAIKSSFSFRIGRSISWLPRKIRSLINRFRYSFNQ